ERPECDVCSMGGNHVEVMHRFREVHRVVEPELLVVLGHELGVIWIGGLRAFGAGHDFEVAGQGKTLGVGHLGQTSLGKAPSYPASSLRGAQRRSNPERLGEAP